MTITTAPPGAPGRTGTLATLVLASLGSFLAALDVDRTAHPMLPLAYFRRRGFTTANGVIFAQFVLLVAAVVPLIGLIPAALAPGREPAAVQR
jgi:hypothetical protein